MLKDFIRNVFPSRGTLCWIYTDFQSLFVYICLSTFPSVSLILCRVLSFPSLSACSYFCLYLYLRYRKIWIDFGTVCFYICLYLSFPCFNWFLSEPIIFSIYKLVLEFDPMFFSIFICIWYYLYFLYQNSFLCPILTFSITKLILVSDPIFFLYLSLFLPSMLSFFCI